MRKVMDIEDLLVWVYRDQKADVIIRRGAGLFDQEAEADGVGLVKISGDGCVRIEQEGLLGHRVDGGGLRSWAGALHPDAEAVYEAVQNLGRLERQVIRECATAGERPDWLPGARPKMAPVLNKKGRPVMIWNESNKPIACKITIECAQGYIDGARMIYAAWWDGMAEVAASLKDSLKSVYPSAPAVAREPWNC